MGQFSGIIERADVWRVPVGVVGALVIAMLQLRLGLMEAPFFSLFFWCVTVTRFLGFVAAMGTIATAVVVGNVYLLEPRGMLSVSGYPLVLCFFFVVMAVMCALMIFNIELHVRRQQDLLDKAEQTAKHNKSLADALGQAVTARDTFLAVAGHELKSPVTGLMLQTQVWQRRLARRSVDAAEMQKAWHRQSEALSRLASLVENLLDVSRINGGQLQLNPDRTNLSHMVKEVAARYSDAALQAGSTLEVHAEPDVVGQWDKMRLEQVVGNLLSNAVKYGAGSPVKVSLHKEEDAAVLHVIDHGKGISRTDRERIFECFERVSIESHVEGLGLGLWIVRQIVDAAGGRIGVESTEGKGATFKVVLPLHMQSLGYAGGNRPLPRAFTGVAQA